MPIVLSIDLSLDFNLKSWGLKNNKMKSRIEQLGCYSGSACSCHY
jgi:hypothetical protein